MNQIPKEIQREVFLERLHGNKGCVYFMHISPMGPSAIKRVELPCEITLPEMNTQNSYITVNEFRENSDSRSGENCTHITGFYIDIDCHHGESIDELNRRIENALKEEIIPQPTMKVFTGGGYAFYFLYRDKIPTSCIEAVYVHKAMYDRIFERFEEVLPGADIDHIVKDLPRLCRIPGTFNANRGKWAELIEDNPDSYYTQDELMEGFRITRDDLEKTTGKARDRPKNAITRTRTKNSTDYIEELLSFEDEKPKVGFKFKSIMKANLNRLELLFPMRRWVEGDHRERFLFIYYNCAKIEFGSKEALEMCLEKRSKMEEPLSDRELYNAITHVEEHEENSNYHSSGVFIYNVETMIDRLEMTPEEVEATHALESKNRLLRIEENRKIKANRDDLVAKLILEGKTIVETAEILKQVLPQCNCCVKTVRRIYQKYNFKDVNKIMTNFTVNDSEGIIRPLEGLNKGQQKAVELAESGKSFFIVGGPGTGKTITTKEIASVLEESGKSVRLVAPTALAASNYDEGRTVHSLFRFGTQAPPEVVINDLASIDTIIIDEVFMMDSELYQYVQIILSWVFVKYSKSIQLILVGDPLQLPPISGEYFFSDNSIPQTVVYLDENRRQTDTKFIELLNRVRVGDKSVCEELNAFLKSPVNEDALYLVSYRDRSKGDYSAELINEKYVESLPGKEKIYLPLDGNDTAPLKVRVGEEILFTDNVPGKGYYNGMRGVVRKLTNQYVMVGVFVDGEEYEIDVRRRTFVSPNGRRYRQFPLIAAKAITIHKAQGMTLNEANIDPRVFAEGQLYTALTRVRFPENLHLLRPIRPEDIRANDAALKFDAELKSRSCI